MIEPPNLTGDYKEDFLTLNTFLKSLSNEVDFDNLDGEEITATTVTAGVGLVVDHNLGRIPKRFIVMNQDKQANVFMDTADNKQITIESSVNAVEVKFFIQ